jgi:hypothetical protein
MARKSKLSILKAARELVANPKTWTKGTLARDAAGLPVATASEAAVQFCALGALQRGAGGYTGPYYDVREALYRALDPHTIVEVNDGYHGRTRILKAMDKAIESLTPKPRTKAAA